MGYDLHITRAESWLDAEDHPIGREEWNSYAGRHPMMVVTGWTDWADIGSEPIYEWPSDSEERTSLSWWPSGDIRVAGVYTDYLSSLVAIAADLDANLVGDDGERYTADGIIG